MTGPIAKIGDRIVGEDHPTLIVAELSGNHGGDLHRAEEIVDAAAAAGVDAIKLQTYTPDSLTLASDNEWFTIGAGTAWSGRRLYDLYAEAMTPWEWTEPLFDRARKHGLLAFSTPFDVRAVEELERYDPPAHKIASFELVDYELLRVVAATRRPIIASTGMATSDEIDEAVAVLRDAGTSDLVLLRCNSAYPSPPGDMDLRTITDMLGRWSAPIGLSDHTLSNTTALVAVSLGARVVEKHLTLRRSDGGPDASFSLEPAELADLVAAIRATEDVLGGVRYGPSPSEQPSLAFRRSLFFVRDLRAGEVVEADAIRSIRPASGLAPKHRSEVIGRRVRVDVARATPVTWDVLDEADR